MIMHHIGKPDLKSLEWKKVTILHGCEHKKTELLEFNTTRCQN